MIKIVVSFYVIFCALYLHRTFGGSIHDESDFNLNDQEAKQNQARFQEEIRRAFSPPEEVQQSYDAQNTMVEKESFSNDVTPANGLDEKGAYVKASLVTQGVAFTATLLSDTTYVSEQTVIFDHVIVNEGNCYDSSTGRFKAPARGLYSFSLTVLAAPRSPAVHLFIVKDWEEIGRVYSGGGTGSVMVVTVMDKGQVVYVKEMPGYSQTVHGGHWSTFTGLLFDRYY